MKTDAQKFIDCLADAKNLFDDYPAVTPPDSGAELKFTHPQRFNHAIFEQWSEFCRHEASQKPKIRIIQHQSCTGGSLISKCLAAMPNISLLSEVNPLGSMSDVHVSGFAPSDLTYLVKQGNFPLINELSQKIFKAEIDAISGHLRQLGNYLVIREHSHSMCFVGELEQQPDAISMLLQDDYQVLSALTVRHPVDSYLSIINNGFDLTWASTFDEYCRRYLLFITQDIDRKIFKYEDFVDDPAKELMILCEALELPFNQDFRDIFDINVMTGDSGRSSSIIEKRERRLYKSKFRKEVGLSEQYLKLCQQLNYDPELIKA